MNSRLMRRMGGALLVSVLLAACASKPVAELPPLRMAAQTAHQKALEAIRQGDQPTAAEFWQQALSLYQAQDDWSGQGAARLGLAQIALRNQAPTEARDWLAPMLVQTQFDPALQAQAQLQMVQSWLKADAGVAAMHLMAAEQWCKSQCSWRWAVANLATQIALAKQDFMRARSLAEATLAAIPASETAERSHAHRLLAQAWLPSNATQALAQIEAALVLDRSLARPDWLREDLLLRLQIASQLEQAELIKDTQARLDSLCAAVVCR
ncbi:hypothetical protein [Chitinibacter sp. ZOR0017]|uniref:hypothetical protein n=1 Tax=Chitinibacter sp. ZOR0017 TaxID=1339254 RepID=UPI00064826F1|nr:hypothetical protein [Chitinibacter sp. ZOR0017]